MKVFIFADELYPLYDVYDPEKYPTLSGIVDIPDEAHDRIVAVMKAFWEIQKELEGYYKKLEAKR